MNHIDTNELPFFEQGHLSIECYASLSEEEKSSLAKIRKHFKNSSSPDLNSEKTQRLIDRSYEAMGRTFRNRINRETQKFGRYKGDLDGVFLLISDSIHSYETSEVFPQTPKESLSLHSSHQRTLLKTKRKLDLGYKNLSSSINDIIPSAFTKVISERLHDALLELDKIHALVNDQISAIDYDKRPDSCAESFVHSVCMNLIWNANIRPTRALTDSHQEKPLLRFLKVFYPADSEGILARLYDRERSLLPDQRIGSTFISPA
ncbi:hypothetical protein [Pseudomonas sp. EggHat1]|uniref:hypothetical protein n=1 Tax=Pseudomonas sp. EggHat1 TaxID=2761624 RepID=UPI0018691860|nr:hypothetical protein [Pseudomonas sp. EggHat1]